MTVNDFIQHTFRFFLFTVTDITQPHEENLQFLLASPQTVNKAVVCQGLHCKICMSQWNMHIAVCQQWHGFHKGYTAYTWTRVSDSIPLTLIGVDTRKDSSGGIIKPDTNVLGAHFNMSHWNTHLLYFKNPSYCNEIKTRNKMASVCQAALFLN